MMLVAGEVHFVSECCILPPVGMERGAQGGCRSCGCHHGGHGSDTRLSSWDEFGAVRGAPGSVGSWGAGEVAQQGLVGDVAYKKKLPPNNTVLYLSAGCINPICIQYQSDGKPVSGSVTPSPSGCNSSFTSENQIHISEAHRTERAHFFCSSRSVSVSLMCVHANGVIVTRMSHSLCAPLPAGSASRSGSAPWTLPASSPGLGSVLTTRARHPSSSL